MRVMRPDLNQSVKVLDERLLSGRDHSKSGCCRDTSFPFAFLAISCLMFFLYSSISNHERSIIDLAFLHPSTTIVLSTLYNMLPVDQELTGRVFSF